MASLFDDDECKFFDAAEIELLDSSCVKDDGVESVMKYDVWLRSPGSIKERRSKFLDWMGVDLEEKLDSLEGEFFDRVKEKSEAVLGTSGFEDGFYSTRSSLSCLSNRNSDFSEEFGLRENSACRDGNSNGAQCSADHEEECESTSVSSPSCEHLTHKTNNLVVKTKKNKKKWLSILRSFSCVSHRQAEADEIRTDNDDNDDDVSLGQRVKVRQCKKQQKELSALFKGHDIPAHTGSILTMKFSPDGRYLASAGEDGVVRLWQIVEDEQLNEIDKIDPSCIYFTVNHLSELKPMCLDKDKPKDKLRSLRKTSDSACVIFPPKVFRILEKPLHEFYGHTGEILDLSWSNNNCLLSCSVDRTVRLWRLGFDDHVRVFQHTDYVTCVQFNPVDENYFISGSIDGKVRIWSVLDSQVVDWTDISDIVTAACYRPDGNGGIIGSISGTYHHMQLGAKICLHNKKKSPGKRITSFKFSPHDSSKVMVTYAVLNNLISSFSGVHNAGSQTSASFTSDGKHIVSACEDSNVYVWNCNSEGEPIHPQAKTIRSCERFSTDASVAIPWSGIKSENSDNGQHFHVPDDNKPPLSSPADFSLNQECVFESFPKGSASATWPEEKLPTSMSSAMHKSQVKFLKTSCQSSNSSHVWGLTIVTAGWDGRIRSFHNYGLPFGKFCLAAPKRMCKSCVHRGCDIASFPWCKFLRALKQPLPFEWKLEQKDNTMQLVVVKIYGK
ncbi:hypothetical protein ACFE04_010621 [Oxalis oulophora]